MKMFPGGKAKRDQAFTLVELMIVIAIIGILAAIAVPNFVRYRQRAYNATANADAANAFRAYTAFRSSNATSTCGIATLESYGFRRSENIVATIAFAGGSPDRPYIWTYHPQGTKWYYVVPDGTIYVYNL